MREFRQPMPSLGYDLAILAWLVEKHLVAGFALVEVEKRATVFRPRIFLERLDLMMIPPEAYEFLVGRHRFSLLLIC